MGCGSSKKSIATKSQSNLPQLKPEPPSEPNADEHHVLETKVKRRLKKVRVFNNLNKEGIDTKRKLEMLQDLINLQRESYLESERSEREIAGYEEKLKDLRQEFKEKLEEDDKERMSMEELCIQLEERHRLLVEEVSRRKEDNARMEIPVFGIPHGGEASTMEIHAEYEALVRAIQAGEIKEEELPRRLMGILREYLPYGAEEYADTCTAEEVERLKAYDDFIKLLQGILVDEIAADITEDDDYDEHDYEVRVRRLMRLHKRIVKDSMQDRSAAAAGDTPIPTEEPAKETRERRKKVMKEFKNIKDNRMEKQMVAEALAKLTEHREHLLLNPNEEGCGIKEENMDKYKRETEALHKETVVKLADGGSTVDVDVVMREYEDIHERIVTSCGCRPLRVMVDMASVCDEEDVDESGDTVLKEVHMFPRYEEGASRDDLVERFTSATTIHERDVKEAELKRLEKKYRTLIKALVMEGNMRTFPKDKADSEGADEVIMDLHRRMERLVDTFCRAKMEVLDTIPEEWDNEGTEDDDSENEDNEVELTYEDFRDKSDEEYAALVEKHREDTERVKETRKVEMKAMDNILKEKLKKRRQERSESSESKDDNTEKIGIFIHTLMSTFSKEEGKEELKARVMVMLLKSEIVNKDDKLKYEPVVDQYIRRFMQGKVTEESAREMIREVRRSTGQLQQKRVEDNEKFNNMLKEKLEQRKKKKVPTATLR